MIPVAIQKIKEYLVERENGEELLPSNYSSYMDSFGISVRMSGLLQTVAFYEKDEKKDEEKDEEKDGKKDGNRKPINKLLLEVLAENDESLKGKELLSVVCEKIKDPTEYRKFEERVIEATIACKLAMKTFKKKKVEESE
jgi:CRISPR type III-B/RAMP module-associated protein Cmr5